MEKTRDEIRLRKAHSRDVYFLRELFNTPIIMDIFALRPSTTSRWMETLKVWIEDNSTHPYIVENKTGPVKKQGIVVLKEDSLDLELIWLELIAFTPSLWGSGKAGLALDSLFRMCSREGKKKIRLRVSKENGWAQKFFQKNGFSNSGEVNELFGDNRIRKPRLIMERKILALEKRRTPERSS